jgi:hypothetical protein
LKDILPSKQFLTESFETQDEITKQTIRNELSNALQELPTREQIMMLLTELSQANKRRDRAMADVIGAKLDQLLTVQPATEEQLRDV